MSQRMKARSKPRLLGASLKREQTLYETDLPRWLEDHRNAHVLMKGSNLVGFYETRDEALAAGYARFGVVPLLLEEVQDHDPIHHIPNVLL